MYIPQEGIISNAQFIEQLSENYPVAKSKGIQYLNIPAAFDIETSSFYARDEKRAITYELTLGIYNLVTITRTWDDMLRLLDQVSEKLKLTRDRRLIIYIANLSYEFQFMRKHFEWDKLFLTEERKPLYALTGGIEFRCSQRLAGGKGVAAVGKDLQKYKVEKRVGDLDYSLLRTPLTPLSPAELGYCENDVRVVLHYIQEKIESDGKITKIPLTNTGYVRNYCRKSCYERWVNYREYISELIITPNEYEQLKKAFQGGFTHANPKWSCKVLEHVTSLDLRSSYPTVMVLDYFPVSQGRLIDSELSDEEFQELLETHCCLFDAVFEEVTPKLNQDHPISSSKCWRADGVVEDNGRIVAAHSLAMTITELDYDTYRQFYNWDSIKVSNMRVYRRGYLPKNYIKAILKLYGDKTTLKHVEGEEVNYMISKNMINAAYGMIVTDINHDEFQYVDNDYISRDGNLEENIKKYNDSKKRFLFYPWGVWVTAHARHNLFAAIIECGQDYIYSDTDSVKIFNYEVHKPFFERYRQQIDDKIKDVCEWYKLDGALFSPKNKHGEVITLGYWDYEGQYQKFKTLGAKRYLVEKDGKLELTVAGVNKKKACEYLSKQPDPFTAFDDNLVVPVDYTGRQVLTYIDEEQSGFCTDYLGQEYEYHELSSIHMEGTEYHLSLSDEYRRFLKGMREDSED